MFRRSDRGSEDDLEFALRNHSTSQLLRRARACLEPRKGEAGIAEAMQILEELRDRHSGGTRHTSRRKPDRGERDDRVLPFGDNPRHRE